MKWYDITLRQYQEIERINETQPDDLDRLAFVVCLLWGMSEEEVDNMGARKFLKCAAKVQRLFDSKPSVPWWRYRVSNKFITDATKITFGQFIEVQHWVKSGVVYNMHLLAASIHKGNQPHHEKAEGMLERPAPVVMLAVGKFMESFDALVKSYAGLFELNTPVVDEDGDKPMKEQHHAFLDQYGWIFSATKVADHEGIKLEDAFNLPVVQALNDMSYLKSKQKYEEWLAKK